MTETEGQARKRTKRIVEPYTIMVWTQSDGLHMAAFDVNGEQISDLRRPRWELNYTHNGFELRRPKP